MSTSNRSTRVVLAIFILIAVVSLACGISVPRVTSTPPTPASVNVAPPPTANPSQVTLVTNEDQVLVDLYSRLNPSVVNITVYLDQSGDLVTYAQGSGFVYDDQGHILTNAHVVHGTNAIEVTFSDGLAREATLVGEDLNSDLAVVKVDLPSGVRPLTLGSMDGLAVGQTVVAIGNPFGLEGTLTRGIISALGRTIPALNIYSIPQAIQTDAAINPGNSGGPLLNLSGEVVGINAQIETGSTSDSNIGIGFAIPVSIISRVAPSLIQNGRYDWPWLGVSGNDLTPFQVSAMSLPVEQGAYVVAVTDGGPAQAAGLIGTSNTITQDGHSVQVGGDVITAVDGQPVKSFDDVLVYLSLHASPGQRVSLTILRDNQIQDVTLTLGTRPAE